MRRIARLPVRWRLALTSAALTFLILLLFATVAGALTARQVRASFDDDLRATAGDLQSRVRVVEDFAGRLELRTRKDIVRSAAAGDAVVRVLNSRGQVMLESGDAPDLGEPSENPRDVGDWRVVSAPLFGGSFPGPIAYVQYAKPRESLTHTVARVKVFLGFGVVGGTVLALLAGLAVARRAMAPIAELTRAAREIARTRDAAVTLPPVEADDEIADLSRTLEEMLHELDAARREIQGMLERQREFVADASHELRTPLTSILANLELLENELQGEDAETVQAALRSSRRMRGLVADLLLLARADARRERAPEPVDVSQVIRQAAAEAAPLATGHDLEVDAQPGIWIDGSREDLHRLVLNLIENALTHTPSGTAVRAHAHRDGNQVVIAVEDHGPGLPQGIQGRAFERFVSGEGDGGRGSGLGLAIVDAVATSHGGKVEYEDRPGGGARFTVRIPVSSPRQGESPSPTAYGLRPTAQPD
jgi:signal transduction histidine kinase